MVNSISIIVLLAVSPALAYLYLLALAAIRIRSVQPSQQAHHRFSIAIPAHNEEAVIGQTVASLQELNYPSAMYDIFVVADHCVDRTAEETRAQGAICFERHEGYRGGKGDALHWLFERIFATGIPYDAVVVFDADTQVDADFLKVMNARLTQGAQVIQGRHIISNPRAGWFPALTWAMMVIDNRYSNQGRANLNLSAKLMGDSICFRSEVLRALGWGSGLTEDYEFRLRLLLQGIHIQYEPQAIGYGQAPLTWKEAQAQRSRWLRGTSDAHKRYGKHLLRRGIEQRDWGMLDGVLSSSLPSYSTLTLISAGMLLCLLVFPAQAWPILTYLCGGVTILWFVYPLMGLALEKAPWWAYLAILSGPVFMLWRTWLRIRVRLAGQTITWIRTPHQGETSTRVSR